MDEIARAFALALELMLSGDRELYAIVALSLQPTQLRIGRLVGIASGDLHPEEDTGPEIAYVTEDGIVIEPYTPLFHRW